MLTVIQTMESYDLPIDMSQTRSAFELRQEVRQAMGLANTAKSSRRPPHKTTEAQKRILLSEFEKEPNPSAEKRDELARRLNVERRIIKNWFSNQRALRRKTGQGYRGWNSNSSQSGDERDANMEGDDYEDTMPSASMSSPPQTETGSSTPDSSYPPSPVSTPSQPVFRQTTNNSFVLTRPLLPKPSHDVPPAYISTLSYMEDRHIHSKPSLSHQSSMIVSSTWAPYPPKSLHSYPAFGNHGTPHAISVPAMDEADTESDSDMDDDDNTSTPAFGIGYPTSALRSSLNM